MRRDNTQPRFALKNILVVGDWLVDEHWVVGVHRSRTSSRVGKIHYRSIQNLQSTVTSFCGAGRTAAILHRAQLTRDNDNLYGIVGFGIWHQNDTCALEAMLDSESVRGRTPHQMTLSYDCGDKTRRLVNLIQPGRLDREPGTTRVIRIYQQTGSKVKLIERIDWEVKEPQGGWFSTRDLLSHVELKNALNEFRPSAIVVKDMLKGAISVDLIKFLRRKLPNVSWFVSSKCYLPEWVDNLDPEQLRLFEIPQAAVQDAVEQGELDSWLTRAGDPSKGALNLLDSLGERFPNALVVAVPNDQTVLAHRSQHPSRGHEKEGVFWASPRANPLSVGLPMASVCFAAFTAYLLSESKFSLGRLVDLSLAFTERWRSYEAMRVDAPVEWNPKGEPCLDLSGAVDTDLVKSESFGWTAALERFREAYRGLGVISEGSKGYIELWRAMTEVKNYVCIAKSKRKVLRRVVREIESFKREKGTRSCVIVASPGSGKSLLAQLLSEDHGLYFLEFNITQMMSKPDILDCFDAILTTQFENPGKRILVFIDEIDAHLDGEAVYDAFLAPLERGVYRRAGKTFPIQPCFWLFAASKDPTTSREPKARDFISRLTLKPCVLGIDPKDDYRLETVYLGVAILRAEFPDVREVSTDVLEVFRSLRKDTSIRELRQFVRDFVDIKSGEVRWSNLPVKAWFGKLGIGKMSKPHRKDRMIEVRGQAVSPSVFARFTPESN